MNIDPDDSCCDPIDLKSRDATLPDQSSGFNESPKMRAMQRMIDDRIGEKNDPTGGMKGNDTPSRSFST